MRYPGAEKLEIIRLVEQSTLPVRRTLQQLGVSPATFYRWYECCQAGGPEALADRPSRPDRGSVRNSVFSRSVERHGQARALVNRWPKITANWALAMAHSRGGMVHSFSVLFKTR
jgi:transposase-like protein